MRPGITVQISISIPRELDTLIREMAVKEDRSLSNWCARALKRAAEEADNDR